MAAGCSITINWNPTGFSFVAKDVGVAHRVCLKFVSWFRVDLARIPPTFSAALKLSRLKR